MKNLPLNSYAFRELELDYKEWLALLGYAENHRVQHALIYA